MIQAGTASRSTMKWVDKYFGNWFFAGEFYSIPWWIKKWELLMAGGMALVLAWFFGVYTGNGGLGLAWLPIWFLLWGGLSIPSETPSVPSAPSCCEINSPSPNPQTRSLTNSNPNTPTREEITTTDNIYTTIQSNNQQSRTNKKQKNSKNKVTTQEATTNNKQQKKTTKQQTKKATKRTRYLDVRSTSLVTCQRSPWSERWLCKTSVEKKNRMTLTC